MPLTRLSLLTTPLLRVGPSSVHGLGAFATAAAPKGTLLGFYDGKRYSADVIDSKTWNDQLTYLFVLSDGTTIDAGRGGNATRHLNHACAPNCEATEAYDAAGRLVLEFRALRKLKVDEELFIDYRLQADASSVAADYLCTCGAATCRGTMLDPDHPAATR
ncbi:MAG: protein-lysine N-methyltransferase [Variovorax sp.]|nr:protein-lysine N-methyltransferase [Variovorax sp.]